MSRPQGRGTAEGGTRKAKGVLLVDHVRMIRSAKDPRLLDPLPREDREIIASRVMASSWYPYETYVRTLDVIFREIGGSNPEVARDMGRFMASRLLAGPYSMYVKVGDPQSTLLGFQIIWKNFFNFGTVRLAPDASTPPDAGRRVFNGTIDGFPDMSKPLCFIVQGFLDKTLEMCGAPGRFIEELTCAASGDPACSYRTGWRVPPI